MEVLLGRRSVVRDENRRWRCPPGEEYVTAGNKTSEKTLVSVLTANLGIIAGKSVGYIGNSSLVTEPTSGYVRPESWMMDNYSLLEIKDYSFI